MTFGTVLAPGFHVDSDTQITALTPRHAPGPVHVSVHTSVGPSPKTSADRYFFHYAPVISDISPASGPLSGGAVVTITGAHFLGDGAGTSVRFGSHPATQVTVRSDSLITATAPAHAAGFVHVSVQTSRGTSRSTDHDRFHYVKPPEITDISPAGGPLAGGTHVTLTGKHFLGTSVVKFGSLVATNFTVVSDHVITATTAAHPEATVDIHLRAPGGPVDVGSHVDRFHYRPAPRISRFTPTSGDVGGGTPVTITGTNFSLVKDVTFGPKSAESFTLVSPTTIIAIAPWYDGPQQRVIHVVTAGGRSESDAGLFFYPGEPRIDSVTDLPHSSFDSGPRTVRIRGLNFYGVDSVSFNYKQALSINVVSPTELIASLPSGFGKGRVRVNAYGGYAVSAQDYPTL